METFWYSSLSASAQVDVDDPSAAAEARRLLGPIVEELGFDETTRGEAAIVVTELAGNLARHARGGKIFMQAMGSELEILAMDRGPGMKDVGRSLSDGYSTAGTPGTGLGAVRRLSRVFDIHSTPGRGTVIVSRIAPRSVPQRAPRLTVGGMAIPALNETVCGDAWALAATDGTATAMLADGLGHGPDAAAAASAAVGSLRRHPRGDATEQMSAVHDALRPTRGAAVAVASIPLAGGELRFAGLGNVAATLRSGSASKNLVSTNGIAGHHARRPTEFRYQWLPHGIFVMHSDGLSSHWSLDEPGLMQRHPSIISGVLVRDFSRGRDDTSVLVVRLAVA